MPLSSPSLSPSCRGASQGVPSKPPRRERSQCGGQPASVDFTSLQHMSVGLGGPPSWERGLPSPSAALAGFGYPRSAYPEPTYGSLFQIRAFVGFSLSEFFSRLRRRHPLGLAELSCWFHGPASELHPPVRAVPTKLQLSKQGSLDSPRVSSLRQPPRSPALHFWSAPLLHFYRCREATVRCFRVPLPRSSVIFRKFTVPL